jgi:hypothetical protein
MAVRTLENPTLATSPATSSTCTAHGAWRDTLVDLVSPEPPGGRARIAGGPSAHRSNGAAVVR